MSHGRIRQFIRSIKRIELGILKGGNAEVFGVNGVQYLLDEPSGAIAEP